MKSDRSASRCRVSVEGVLPRAVGLSRRALREAAAFFASRSAARVGVPFRAVTVILQDDAFSAEVHLAINGAAGATDVVTQRYDALPGEVPGVYGELYVNCDRAVRAAPKRRGWSAAKELLLYVAHGMDHLSGADDLEPADFVRMRRRELAWLKAWAQPGGRPCRALATRTETTAASTSRRPVASRAVKASSNAKTPMATAVSGSRAPRMAVGVAPRSREL